MGCTQSSYATPSNLPAQLINRLIQVSDVNHQLNVNVKYQYLCKIDQSKTTGHGLKKTFSYHCLTTKQQLQLKRKQFWETRNSGSPETWSALNHVVTTKNGNPILTSEDQIASLLNKAKVTPLNASIQMCVDPNGSKYQLPVFVINDPISYENEKIADRNLIKDYEKCNFKVNFLSKKLKIRSVKFPNEDILLQVNSSDLIEVIKKKIRENKQLGNTPIRLFYNGREMADNHTLGNYGYIADTIIQAMIK